MLLATSALASAALPTTLAHADPVVDATWLPTQPVDGDAGNFNNRSHWTTPDGTPTIPTGTATFNASNIRAITFNDLTTTVGGIAVTSGAGDYKFETNGKSITFNGAGLSVGSGASLTINNRDGGTVIFSDSSKAGHADPPTVIDNFGGKLLFAVNASAETVHINNFSSGTDAFKFDNESTAANAQIFNHGDLHFAGNSTAGNANIVSFIIESSVSESHIFIEGNANGGTAHIVLDNGSLDISNLLTAGTTVGSIDGSGNVTLGTKNLSVGGDNLDTGFSGVIQDGPAAPLLGGGGSLTKEGTGTLTLTGIHNTYTGTTTVNGGALVVDGSIEKSSGVIVNAGGTLAGTGTVSSTEIKVGGTLAPGHSDGSFGKLTVR
jgi:autotransporter-associated beta strand protein